MITRSVSLVLAALALAGCATPQHNVPVDVAIMPNDCANRGAIERWILNQQSIPRQNFQSEQSYAQQQSQIKHRLWTLRYNCYAH